MVMETVVISETSDICSRLIRFVGRQYFIIFSQAESLKSYRRYILTEVFSGFIQSLQANVRIVPLKQTTASSFQVLTYTSFTGTNSPISFADI